jgi:glycosyltransferase involved in cell wall biosynthesis
VNSVPEVSVIIATYNRARLLKRAIQSVLNQTYQDFELIVVDDGSADDTKQVVKSFSDSRIGYIRHEENKGEAAARNTGIRAARCEYIAFHDSDDEWLQAKLEKQMAVFQRESSRVGIVYTSMCRIDKEGKRYVPNTPTIMPEDGLVYRKALDYGVRYIGIGTAAVRKTCFNIAGMFDERLPYYVDLDFFIRAAKHFCFYHIKEPLINYYEAEGTHANNLRTLAAAREMILENYFDDIRRDSKLLARHYFQIGNLLCLNGQLGEGRRYLLRAVAVHSLNIKYFLGIIASFFGLRVYGKVV